MKHKALTIRVFIAVAFFVILMIVAYIFQEVLVKSNKNECLNNLRIIHSGMTSAAMEMNLPKGASIPIKLVARYQKGGVLPVCPSGGEYIIPPCGKNPKCSYHGDLLKNKGVTQ